MALIAKIAVAAAPYAIDRPFDYLVPDSLAGSLVPGMRVAVPFGSGNRTSDGIVLSCQEQELPLDKNLKTILAQLDCEAMLSETFLRLALWMRERYFCTVYDAARIMLPAGLWFSLKDCWRIAPGVDKEHAYHIAGNSKTATRLIDMLFANGGWAEVGQIRLAFGTSDPGPAIKLLSQAGVITTETSMDRGIGDKTELVAELLVPAEDAIAFAETKRRRAPLQYSVIETLCSVGRVSAKELCYFTGASMATLRTLEKGGILSLTKREVFRRPNLPPKQIPPELILTESQNSAYEGIRSLLGGESAEAAVLYGVTGSGKTLVYIKLIQELSTRGKSVIVMVPEIALTPQLVERFIGHFGDSVALLHSSLSAGERYDEWKRIKNGTAKVVVGTRSAVFAPVHNLGAIIIDEEQEQSYKSEQTPRYHAREVAKYRCVKENALLLMGSATPTLETMFYAKVGRYKLFELNERFNAQELPHVEIIDMKQELRRGNGTCISKKLYQELSETINRGEQAILFLNRRGASRMVTCGECGQIPSCPRCSVHLTYHSANNRLMCHYCGHSQPLPKYCPECDGLLNFVGIGTQKAEEELKRLFPDIEILRMDTDTVTATNSHEHILKRFRDRRVPILLGTQMVAKGLDFENVTLVGVLAADQSLYTDDYRAGERTFSLLTQVVGRAGRGSKKGCALIQTFTPENDVITCAAAQDYDTFYQQELRIRNVRECPPFGDILMIGASGLEETSVLRSCARLRDALIEALAHPDYAGISCRLLGPAPASVAKVNNRYRYRLILNIENSQKIRRLIAHMLRMSILDKQNRGVSFFADFDPAE